jgi:dodecin
MSIVRSIEVIAQSPSGFDEACREAVKEASKTLRGIRSFWIKNAECIVENDRITSYRVNGKISFILEDSRSFRVLIGGGRTGIHSRERAGPVATGVSGRPPHSDHDPSYTAPSGSPASTIPNVRMQAETPLPQLVTTGRLPSTPASLSLARNSEGGSNVPSGFSRSP